MAIHPATIVGDGSPVGSELTYRLPLDTKLNASGAASREFVSSSGPIGRTRMPSNILFTNFEAPMISIFFPSFPRARVA